MDLWIILKDVVFLLAGCLLVGGVFSRFGQSPLVGYILVGMILGGPGSFNVFSSESEIEAISELGVALLLFSLGLEFSVKRLRDLGLKPLVGGVVQVVLTTVIGALVANQLGLGFREATAFGAMVALSSTAVVLRLLMERSELEMPHGRNSLAVLLTQDMAVVPLALLMTVLGGEGSSQEILLDVSKLAGMATALVVCLFLLNKIAVIALGTLTLHQHRELTVILAVVAGLGAAWASHAVGISPALGAFVAGMMLGSSAFATQIRADVAPLRVVLLTLFFGAAGMVADPMWILNNWYLVAVVTALVTFGKLLVIWSIFIALGQTTRVAAATGLCLAQIGEFAFVLGSIGRTSGVVREETYALVVSVAVVSFFLSAFLVPWSPRFGDKIAALLRSEQREWDRDSGKSLGPEVVVVGYGPSAQIAVGPLVDRGLRVTILELNHEGIKRARQRGFKAELGDARQSDVLEHVNLSACEMVLITVPHHVSAMTILEHVRKEAPQARVIVRSRYHLHTHTFESAGAFAVAGDEEQVGEALAEQLKQWLEETRPTTPAEGN